jgi:ATP-binding cassette subfamily F protein 3
MFSGDEIEKYVKVLSGGEKARVALARMLVEPSHILLLDEPTNHLDMVTRNVVERALIQFSGSIVCISHDRHFLNNVTNITCEVAGGGIRLFEGNYEYYEWKKKEEIQKSTRISKVKIESTKKSDYKEQKKVRNRLAWIDKRFKTIENEIEKERALTNNPDYNDNYEILEDALNNMNTLEKEYLELMEEQERLLK